MDHSRKFPTFILGRTQWWHFFKKPRFWLRCTQLFFYGPFLVPFLGTKNGPSRSLSDHFLKGVSPCSDAHRMLLVTLWLFNIAMEHGSFIDGLPINTSIYKGFSMAMLNNQMVYKVRLLDVPLCSHKTVGFMPILCQILLAMGNRIVEPGYSKKILDISHGLFIIVYHPHSKIEQSLP